MRLPILATTVMLAAAFTLAAATTAVATHDGCPPGWEGVWVDTPTGPVYMCCDFNQDPTPCYVWRPTH